MKKSLIALAVLGSFAGAASAANTVTLWGKVDTAYVYGSSKVKTYDQYGNLLSKSSTSGRLKMSDADESRIGIKVNEDLGNGLSAFVRLEGSMTSDVGTGVGFNRESVIGLKGNFGSFYFGRSITPLEQITIGADTRSGGTHDAYLSKDRWSNTAFYTFEGQNANSSWGVYAAVSTPGGQFNNSAEQEHVAPTIAYNSAAPYGYFQNTGNKRKIGYGLSAKYKHTVNDKMSFSVGAGFQADNDNMYNNSGLTIGYPASLSAVNGKKIGVFNTGVKNEWLVNGTFTFKPVTFGLSYAQSKLNTSVPVGTTLFSGVTTAPSTSIAPAYYGYGYGDNLNSHGKARHIRAFVQAEITPNDIVYAQYGNVAGKVTVDNRGYFGGQYKASVRSAGLGIGYEHKLSKRTSVFFNAGRTKTTETSSYTNNYGYGYGYAVPVLAKPVATTTKTTTTNYDIGLRHSF